MISAINSQFQFGQLAELVYALVLGTSSERIVSSSLTLPTTKKVEKINSNSDYETVYVFGITYTEGRKEGTVVLDFNEVVSLRKYRPFTNLSHVASIVVITSFFLNFHNIHKWVVSYTNVYRPPYTAYMWVEN